VSSELCKRLMSPGVGRARPPNTGAPESGLPAMSRVCSAACHDALLAAVVDRGGPLPAWTRPTMVSVVAPAVEVLGFFFSFFSLSLEAYLCRAIVLLSKSFYFLFVF
jgi:hypothetical protein